MELLLRLGTGAQLSDVCSPEGPFACHNYVTILCILVEITYRVYLEY